MSEYPSIFKIIFCLPRTLVIFIVLVILIFRIHPFSEEAANAARAQALAAAQTSVAAQAHLAGARARAAAAQKVAAAREAAAARAIQRAAHNQAARLHNAGNIKIYNNDSFANVLCVKTDSVSIFK